MILLHAAFVQEALHAYGITGPIRVYGHPLQPGAFITMMYYPTANSRDEKVQIDLFFGRPVGHLIQGSLWFPHRMVQMTFESALHGARLADWFGEEVFVPYHVEDSLVDTYGRDFMVPQSRGEYAVFPSRHMEGKLAQYLEPRYLSGHLISFREMCDLAESHCPSRFGRWHQLLIMIKFFHQFAISQGLGYTLACDLLAYHAHPTGSLPEYASIAVQRSDRDSWRELLHNVTFRTTYVIEKHADGSWLHMRFSRQSSTRLVVHFVPDNIILEAPSVQLWHPDVKFSALVHKSKTVSELESLIGMCKACDLCKSLHGQHIVKGFLRNSKTDRCLSLRKSASHVLVQLTECHSKV
jgi:hypothetical protein